MSRTNNPKFNKGIKKEKPKSNDPKPKIKDFPNREAYRQAVLKWNKRRKDRIAKEKTEELKQKGLEKTSRGVRPTKNKNNLKVKPKGPFAKDRVGKADLTSSSYKQAKAVNESLKINKKVKTNELKDEIVEETITKDNKDNKENKVEKKEVKKEVKKKIPKGSARNFIKTKKGFARRGTPMAKRAEEREKRRKRLAAKGYMKNR